MLVRPPGTRSITCLPRAINTKCALHSRTASQLRSAAAHLKATALVAAVIALFKVIHRFNLCITFTQVLHILYLNLSYSRAAQVFLISCHIYCNCVTVLNAVIRLQLQLCHHRGSSATSMLGG